MMSALPWEGPKALLPPEEDVVAAAEQFHQQRRRLRHHNSGGGSGGGGGGMARHRSSRRRRAGRLEQLAEHMRKDSPHCAKTVQTAAIPPAMPSVSAGMKFIPCPEHFKLPHGFFMREATSVAVDSQDNVFVFNRGNVPVLVFDPAGNLIDHWGNSTPYDGTEQVTHESFRLFGDGFELSRWRGSDFMRPHAIFIDHQDKLWLVDDLANVITKCDRHGNRELLLAPEGRVGTCRCLKAFARTYM